MTDIHLHNMTNNKGKEMHLPSHLKKEFSVFFFFKFFLANLDQQVPRYGQNIKWDGMHRSGPQGVLVAALKSCPWSTYTAPMSLFKY